MKPKRPKLQKRDFPKQPNNWKHHQMLLKELKAVVFRIVWGEASEAVSYKYAIVFYEYSIGYSTTTLIVVYQDGDVHSTFIEGSAIAMPDGGELQV